MNLVSRCKDSQSKASRLQYLKSKGKGASKTQNLPTAFLASCNFFAVFQSLHPGNRDCEF